MSQSKEVLEAQAEALEEFARIQRAHMPVPSDPDMKRWNEAIDFSCRSAETKASMLRTQAAAHPQAQVAAQGEKKRFGEGVPFLEQVANHAGDMSAVARLLGAPSPQSAVAQENGIPAEVLAALREAQGYVWQVRKDAHWPRPEIDALDKRIDALLTKYSRS